MKLSALISALLLFTAVAAVLAAPPKGTPVTVAVQGFHCQPCPDSLAKDLAKVKGVSAVKATLKPAQVTAVLDEKVITASQFVAAIANHPTLMDPQKKYGASLVVYVDSKSTAKEAKMCADCTAQVTKALKGVKGVSGVTTDATGKVVSVTFAKGAKVSTGAIGKALGATKLHFTGRFTNPKPAAVAAAGAKSGGGCPMMSGGKAAGAKSGSCPKHSGAKATGAKSGGSCDMSGGSCDMGGGKSGGSCPMMSGGKAAGTKSGGSCAMHGGKAAGAKSGGSCAMHGGKAAGAKSGGCPMHSGAKAATTKKATPAQHHAAKSTAKPAAHAGMTCDPKTGVCRLDNDKATLGAPAHHATTTKK